jgi:1-deoxy-D-xylulose-5-phosphate reductoisomerase
MKRIAVLGSTGSIGTSTLAAVEEFPDRFRVVTLAAGRDLPKLRDQMRKFRPVLVSVADSNDAEDLAAEFPAVDVQHGDRGLARAACHTDVDVVVAALVGVAGLPSTIAAIRAGKNIALANKEVLVVAGELVTTAARTAGIQILPIDSELNAIHQAMRVGPRDAVARLVITASGGPFRTWTAHRIANATIDHALAHPTWRMGPKISVDSATMMNKGLEIIEAHHLFGVSEDRIDVVIHPQSLVHSLVEYIDGSMIAQLSTNDMRCPILSALAWPERLPSPVKSLDLAEVAKLEFFPPDPVRFPALRLARHALRAGGEMPAVLNSVNEEAVQAFLAGECTFAQITDTVDAVLSAWAQRNRPLESLDQAWVVDRESRRIASEHLGKYRSPAGGSQ